MDVRKTIAELTSQLSEIDYGSDEDNVLLKGSKNNYDYGSPEEDADYEGVQHSQLRKTTDSVTLPDNIYGGKKTTRKKTYSITESSDNESFQRSVSDVESSEHVSNKSDSSDNEEESEFEDVSERESPSDKKNEERSMDIYSTGNNNVSDVKKGNAIRNQLRIWESLLECRIKLQKGLSACNDLPPKEDLLKETGHLQIEDKQKLNKCKKNLLTLLEKMVELQNELMKVSQEMKKNKDIELKKQTPSDESEIEDDEEVKADEDIQTPKKKRKLNDYSSEITSNHIKFIPFRNASIQKWNDKTKISTGKMANSNFSAFDHSTLKQIEQIMVDKSRLVNRTRIKRNENRGSGLKNQTELSQDIPLDPEIFDDTDFYHKLLRDYIERKSVDSTNSTYTERQMIELQKLRSKMKKNVDTKSTKGRKIRYTVLPKLVNFMAPNPYSSWSEQAETELFNSLFGTIKAPS